MGHKYQYSFLLAQQSWPDTSGKCSVLCRSIFNVPLKKLYRMLNSTSNLKYESEMYFVQALLKKQFITALNLSDKRKGDFSLLISCIEAMTN